MTRDNEEKLARIIKSVCRLDLNEQSFSEKLSFGHLNIMEDLGFDSILIVELVSIRISLTYMTQTELAEILNTTIDYLLVGKEIESKENIERNIRISDAVNVIIVEL